MQTIPQSTNMNSHNYLELPKLPKEAYAFLEAPAFKKDDVKKIIVQIIKKGTRFQELKRELGSKDALLLEGKLVGSSFMVFCWII